MTREAGKLGTRAVVVGAGIAGILAARVLSDHFNEVIILERDDGYDAAGFRKGTPQARLIHGLLRAGLDRMDEAFPGLERTLIDRGAVPCRPPRDLLLYDALGEWPCHDVGPEVPLLSRQLLERTLRERLAGIGNVRIRGGIRVRKLIADAERIAGVAGDDEAGNSHRELGDLIVDASGRSARTLEWLHELGFPAPDTTRVEVDIAYAGCTYRPRRAPRVLGALVSEPPPRGRYCALLHTQEGGRVIVAIGRRGRETPYPSDHATMLSYAEQLPHPIVFDILRNAEPVSPIARFGFPASVHHHYERLERLPQSFVCVGDAICSFNPIWGQGMSVAALQVAALARLLAQCSDSGRGLLGLERLFYAQTARIIATPWAFSVEPDFAYETTRGAQSAPANKERAQLAFGVLAQQDAQVRSVLTDVYHLVKPREALLDRALIRRAMALMRSNSPDAHRRPVA
ncbi:MAG TPA: FAD-dependent monooxygenase [Steroidobacteraceae bacterium]